MFLAVILSAWLNLVPCDITEQQYSYHTPVAGSDTVSHLVTLRVVIPDFQPACTVSYSLTSTVFSGFANALHPNVLCAQTTPDTVVCTGTIAVGGDIQIHTKKTLYGVTPAGVLSSQSSWTFWGYGIFIPLYHP